MTTMMFSPKGQKSGVRAGLATEKFLAAPKKSRFRKFKLFSGRFARKKKDRQGRRTPCR
jgi:hypothetical protein